MDNWGWELSIGWRDKIGKDFKYHVNLNTGYHDNKVNEQQWATSDYYKAVRPGDRSDAGLWGYQCLGMFRSYHDIDAYFDTYLKKDDGTYGKYLGLEKDKVHPGMLIYKDIRGAYDQATGTYAGPDHEVTAEDEVQLSKRSNNIYGFTINAGAEWKGIQLTMQFGANWGSYEIVKGLSYSDDYTNMPSFWNPDDIFVYDDIYDGQGRLIQKANRNGSLPNPGFSINSDASSFWRISAARITLNRLTLAYSLPKAWFKGTGIQSVRFNVTGQNLINFYNDNPDKFFNPMAGNYGDYPNLRKWTIGLNLGF